VREVTWPRLLGYALLMIRCLATALAGSMLLSPAAAAAEKRPAVDLELVGRLMENPEQLKRMIDLRRGLIVLTYNVDSPSDSFEPVTEGERWCGARLKQGLKKLILEVLESWKSHDVDSCHQTRVSAMCSFGFAYEYTTFTHLTFADDGKGGWWLEAVAFLDAGLLSDEAQRTQGRWVRRMMKKLRQAGCDDRQSPGEQKEKQP
jgi:hypothetical protein